MQDIRIPLIIRGPNITAGSVADNMVANIDLGTTILDLAGLAPIPTDGRSLRPILAPESGPVEGVDLAWRDRLVVEYYSMGYILRGSCSNFSGPCPNGPTDYLVRTLIST
jgi:arylsulfatase A-like enzyme